RLCRVGDLDIPGGRRHRVARGQRLRRALGDVQQRRPVIQCDVRRRAGLVDWHVRLGGHGDLAPGGVTIGDGVITGTHGRLGQRDRGDAGEVGRRGRAHGERGGRGHLAERGVQDVVVNRLGHGYSTGVVLRRASSTPVGTRTAAPSATHSGTAVSSTTPYTTRTASTGASSPYR